jgi:hypothetical protein
MRSKYRSVAGAGALMNSASPSQLAGMAGLDYSNIEMRVFAMLARDEKVEPTFSEIYGTKREEIVHLVGREKARSLTLNHIKQYPKTAEFIPGLRKMKARYMVNALIQGMAEAGNHLITCYGNVYHFYYRGTLIYTWNAVTNEGRDIDAGDFEDTASTRNQRKEIKKAILNFKEAVDKL